MTDILRPNSAGCSQLGSPPSAAQRVSSSLAGNDKDQEILQALKELALEPLKEDLAEWLRDTLAIDISADNFVDVLDNGVQVCRLAQIITSKVNETNTLSQPKDQNHNPTTLSAVKYRSNAQPGSWLARDNTTNFINWCRQFGVKNECLFETEGLVLHKDTRSVVLCLLELARLASRYGIRPPKLIQLETEIEAEEKVEVQEQSNDSATPSIEDVTDAGVSRPVQAVAGVKRPAASASSKATKTKAAPKASAGKRSKLDEEVSKLGANCSCPDCKFPVRKISEGRYEIGGKSVLVRMLNNHLMVRVGGGWDTLRNYLVTHDPCRIKEIERQIGEGKFMIINAKYKSP